MPCRGFVLGRTRARLSIADMFDYIAIRREGAAFPPRPKGRCLHAAILMTATTTTIEQPAGGGLAWYALSPQDVTTQMGVDADTGLTVAEVERRLAEYGPNELPTEPPPSMWAVAREQLANPMNIMLLIVVAASFAIVQIATALVVLGLVLFNV